MQTIKKTKVQTLVRGAIAPLFDRLIDNEPNLLEEDPVTYVLTAEGIKASIQRELELLLNTRPTDKSSINSVSERLPSTYGLPEIAWENTIRDSAVQSVATLIEQTISYYEPRLKDVQVIITGRNAQTLGLSLQITALLNLNDTHERIHFPLNINNILKR